MNTTETDPLISSAEIRRQLGDVSDMTIWRWEKAGILPEPIKINGRKYWRQSVATKICQNGAKKVRAA